MNKRLADNELSIQLSAGVFDHIASTGYDPVYGARLLKRAIENLIENPLAEEVLRGSYLAGDAITLELDATHGLVFGKLMTGLDQAVVYLVKYRQITPKGLTFLQKLGKSRF